MTVRAALFDLDGTLVDSLEDLTDAVNCMLAGFNRNPLSIAEVRRLVGKGARNLVQRALGTESHEEIDRGFGLFVAFNTAHIADKSRLYPGVRDALKTLAEHRILMAVVSNKQEALSRLILETLGIDRFFDIIYGCDTFPEMKPSPLPLLKVIERFGLDAGKAVMIGDSINDIQAGRQAGITTIGCSWGYGDPGELQQADLLAHSCNEVTTILLKHEAR